MNPRQTTLVSAIYCILFFSTLSPTHAAPTPPSSATQADRILQQQLEEERRRRREEERKEQQRLKPPLAPDALPSEGTPKDAACTDISTIEFSGVSLPY